LAESNATSYPDKFKAINSRRWNRAWATMSG